LQALLLRLYDKVLKFGNEKLLHTVFFKLNLIGSLYTAYQDIVVNGVQLKMLRTEDFFLTIKKLVYIIREILETRKNIQRFVEMIQLSQSWYLLKKGFL
jgi:hypothetical protein